VEVCYTFSYVHMFITSSHLLIFTSSLSLLLSLSLFISFHLLHIFASSHLHIFTLSLSLSPFPCHLSRFLSFFFSSLFRLRGATKWPPLRTKRGSIVKNCSEIAILYTSSAATFSHEMTFEFQKVEFLATLVGPAKLLCVKVSV